MATQVARSRVEEVDELLEEAGEGAWARVRQFRPTVKYNAYHRGLVDGRANLRLSLLGRLSSAAVAGSFSSRRWPSGEVWREPSARVLQKSEDFSLIDSARQQ